MSSDCGGDCPEHYDGGTSVTLTAAPIAGFRVAGWVGCDTFNGNQCTVVMAADISGVRESEYF